MSTNYRFALVDVNNFYVSCERVFQPKLAHVPVVVLSNNDGCAVARCAQVKALGVKMATPWFQMKDLAKKHHIQALSSNYTLYANMSDRVVTILQDFSSDMEVYSIDESFLRIDQVAHLHGGTIAMGKLIRQRIKQWVGLPVCVGIGSTKTLAKLANHLAKKNGQFNGVCDIHQLSQAEQDRWMSELPTNEIWGIGKQLYKRLQSMQINTILDLKHSNPKKIRSQFGVVVERTVDELNGVSCLELEEVTPSKQQIICSRSFGKEVSSLVELQESIATHITRGCEKLRSQGSVAGGVQVFLQTNRFKEGIQHHPQALVGMPEPSADTLDMTTVAMKALREIYRSGFKYKKAGIVLTMISDKATMQKSIFDDVFKNEKSRKLMGVLDHINQRYGKGSLRTGAIGTSTQWEMRSENRSPNYLTQWDELPMVR